ncbi:MAG: ParB/RepB/Spo0J family partition protein [Alphaproteobacteria bacterium]|nr:ParB/RepB/Spo0J family partition protein [Beijerinckiaceae bacterium]NBQ40733.1 ParB/RepB/Spo0J family partition protein [Alphaproteobacteria bacterium]
MAEEPTRSRLGRGLAALIGDVGEAAIPAERARGQRRVPTEFLRPNPRNPRRTFVEADLDDLVNSVREKGIIQPILVRNIPGMEDVFEIIAGERRWRAAQRASLHEVPIIIVEAGDKEALEIAIIENVQRSDLNALEEALGYEQLIAEYGYSQNDLSKIIGKSRSHIANTIRLARLPDSVKALLASGELTAGHGRALLSVKDPEALARRIIERGMTVRDVERIANEDDKAEKAPQVARRREKDPDTRALEKAIEDVLGLSVSITHGSRGGELKIKYRTLEQLDAVCRRLRD